MLFSPEDYRKIFHEIKNSITLIGGSLQLIEKQHPQIKDVDYWEECMTEIQYLKRMVTELSQYRMGSDLQITDVDLTELMLQIKDCILFIAEESDFHCRLEMPEKLPHIQGDFLQLKLAVINLLKNSYEAMDKHGEVVLSVTPHKNDVEISVTDFGGGVVPELCESLFSPHTTTKCEGTGLGLSITYDIIQSHHGSIHFKNNPPKGCTFFINLPIK